MTSIPAKPTFGTLTQVVFQGDYLRNKKAKLSYCNNRNITNCNKLVKAGCYNEYNLYNKGRYLNALNKGCILPFNKTDLITGQYSKMNLSSVCTVIDGAPCSLIDSCPGCLTGANINASSIVPFCQKNTIDPVGALFGKSPCGINNFTRYMVYKNS
jgi:hypothetical protein